RDREEDPPEPEHGQTQQERRGGADGGAHREPHQHRREGAEQRLDGHHERRDVGAQRGEARLGEAQLPCHEHDVERVGEDRAQRDRGDERVVAGEHQTSLTAAPPNRPRGRSTSTAKSTAKATMPFHAESNQWTVSASASPRTRPAAMAPQREPRPPRTITANPMSSMEAPNPRSACPRLSASSAPATAPSPEERA